MIKITRISKTKQGRYALFTENDEFLFSVDDETLIKHAVQENMMFSDDEFSLLRDDSDIRKAKNQALRYLSLRAYGEQELYNKLCLKYDERTSSAAVASMKDLALLDDYTFTLEKVKGLASRGKGSTDIRCRLRQLGISDIIIQSAMQEVELDDVASAIAVIQKMYADKLRRGEVQKVMAALARRGFPHATIKEAINSVLVEFDE